MGFPLERGSVEDGILTCHWHHARFDLASGCTFDLWADDVPSCNAAREEAIKSAREIVSGAVRSGRSDPPDCILVADGEGRELATVSLADMVPERLRK